MKLADRMTANRRGIRLRRTGARPRTGSARPQRHPPGDRRAGFSHSAHIVEAAKQALDEGWTHYGPTQGLPELREAIAAYVSRTRGIPVGPQHVSVVPGGKPIIFFPMMALLEPGDEVIYPNPGFPIYESMIRFLGATPVPMPLEEEPRLFLRPGPVPRPPDARAPRW